MRNIETLKLAGWTALGGFLSAMFIETFFLGHGFNEVFSSHSLTMDAVVGVVAAGVAIPALRATGTI